MPMAAARSTRDALQARAAGDRFAAGGFSAGSGGTATDASAGPGAAVAGPEPAELAYDAGARAGGSASQWDWRSATCDPGCPRITLTRPALVVILNGSGAARSITTRVTSGRVLLTAARIFLMRESRLGVTAAV